MAADFPSKGSTPHLHGRDNPFSRPQTPHVGIQIGFCGLGAMGYPMAKNLANKPITSPSSASPLLVWNRSRAKSEKLLKELGPEKIRIAENPEELARECDMIFTNLSNDAVVKEIFLKFAAALEVRECYTFLSSLHSKPSCDRLYPFTRTRSS